MKKLISIIALMLLTIGVKAQVPQGFSYQAVVRNADNAPVSNSQIQVLISISQGATAEAAIPIYTESHSATTNANGLFTITIGQGKGNTKFSDIDWSKGNYFITTETVYGNSTTQLLSVPFAMYAAKAGNSEVDLSNYALKSDIPNDLDLTDYAKKSDLPDLTDYVKKTDVATTESLLEALGFNCEVKVSAGVGGTVQGYNGKYRSGQQAIFSAEPDGGYVFTQWSDGCKDNPRTLTVLKDTTIQAIFYKLVTPSNADFVDLGLTSGTLWAACNLGANEPQEYGDYYAWGETTPHYSDGGNTDNPTWLAGYSDGYTWNNYKYCYNSSSAITKYCQDKSYGKDGYTDELTILELSDDAAYVNMGTDWTIPTIDQWNELLNECYWVWTDDYNNSLVAGFTLYKVKNDYDKGRKTFSGNTPSLSYSLSDAHIFLPAAGYLDGCSHIYVGYFGAYWSSSLRDPTDARYLHFFSTMINSVGSYASDGRYDGRSIRPVRR